MRPLNNIFPAADFPQLLVGLNSPDDSAVYQLNDDQAIISTTDFFTPVVDDPYDFGAIAAANALSDIYAMGGEPLFAINLAAFPDGLDLNILTEILRGGAEKVREAGAVIAGGHTITDKEPKYGLAVTGIVHPQRILKKGGAQPGDALILTKPLGTGAITTAHKQGTATNEHLKAAIKSMSHLNARAAKLAADSGANAMTDITGYSLIGHAHEMAHMSGVDFEFDTRNMPWLPGAMEYAKRDTFPGGMHRNRNFFMEWVKFNLDIEDWNEYLLYDPQTSGGLLIAVPQETAKDLMSALVDSGENASVVGHVREGAGFIHFV